MAEISGENGAVYYNEELTDMAVASTIAFDSVTTGATDQTITSSTAGGSTGVLIDFETRGYVAGMLVTVSGATSTGNNRIFTINTVSSGVLTVNEAVSSGTGTDTGTPAFTEAEPGIPVLGFFNWTLSYTGDVLETTNFDDSSGGRSYIAGLTGWTATAEKHFLSDVRETEDWLGTAVEIRLFTKYVATPTTGAPSQFWDGDTVVTGFDETTPVDALISQSISFQGDKALALRTQTQAWNLGIST